ncbi:TAXI family TRAP transporter solute-binding subunit [Desulfospira joergensenii]|uniref:TAXI family TRAP transporter solute-binding subunit n=1 Tax=Desulfospira joergensenii TaxID=53329 RepID=UPI0003B709DA|nr:TAXI family TRAP transporter solute-binding subunit [Desulfospira joergensenii]
MDNCRILKPVRPLFIAFIIIFSCFAPVYGFDILMGTSPSGTLSHFTGRMVERIINRAVPGIQLRVLAGAGDMHNLTNLSQGSLDMALIDSRMLHDAVNKTGNFEFLDVDYSHLTILTRLYDVPILLIAGKGTRIRLLDDIREKRVNAGYPLSPASLAFETILKAKHWNRSDFSLVYEISDSHSQDTMAFCHGNIDAMLHIGAHPDPSLEQLFRLCNASAVDMDDKYIHGLVRDHPAFFRLTIPAGIYPGQDKEVYTFGTQTLLVASPDLDAQTVTAILETLYRYRRRLSASHPALYLKKTGRKEITDLGLKLHPGALDFFTD